MTENNERTIKQSELNSNFKREISEMPGGEMLMRCFQCGTCTSDCPIARFSDNYRPRQIIRMVQLGLREQVLGSDTLWLCAACFTCTDRCPQNVEVANVIRVLRNLATQEGHMPKMFNDQFASILESGYAYKIPELRIKKRESQGLPALPKGNGDKMKRALKGVKLVDDIQKSAGGQPVEQ